MRTCFSPTLALLALTGAWVSPTDINDAIEAPKALDVRVTIETPKGDYLPGEPVQINAILENTSRRALEIDQDTIALLDVQGVYIERDGQPFRQFVRDTIGYCPWMWRTLEPEEQWTFRLRVLYAPRWREGLFPPEDRILPGGLAFPRPGTYRVKVVCPLFLRDVHQQVPLDSNVIAVRIREPEGVDARVWPRIRDEDTLRFLQVGRVPEGREDIILRVADVLEESPTTGYGPALRYALRKAYGQWSHFPADRQERIRTLVGLSPAAERFHPSDERLDAEVVDDVPAGTTVDQVLASLSRQAGVTLKATAGAGLQVYRGPRRAADLRGLMQDLAREHRSVWFGSDRDMYKLWSIEELRQDRELDRRPGRR